MCQFQRPDFIELAIHQPAGTLQDRDFQSEVMQCVGGLDAEHASAENNGLARAMALDTRADFERVIGRAKNVSIGIGRVSRRRQGGLGASCKDEPVIRKSLAGSQTHAFGLAVD